jgi:hypothetical protein
MNLPVILLLFLRLAVKLTCQTISKCLTKCAPYWSYHFVTPQYTATLCNFQMCWLCVCVYVCEWAGVTRSICRLAVGQKVRVSNPGDARFSAPAQSGPGAHRTSCTEGFGSFLDVTWLGRGFNQSPISSTDVQIRVELYLYSFSVFMAGYKASFF